MSEVEFAQPNSFIKWALAPSSKIDHRRGACDEAFDLLLRRKTGVDRLTRSGWAFGILGESVFVSSQYHERRENRAPSDFLPIHAPFDTIPPPRSQTASPRT